jgi:hypothetical protein
MKHLFFALLLVAPCAATSYGQTMKALSYNASNGVIAYSGTNTLTFNNSVGLAQGDYVIDSSGAVLWQGDLAIEVDGRMLYGAWNFDQPGAVRTNLGLGATNTPAFRGLVSDGNIVITNQSATNNGILFVYRTNNEPFLGLANLIASNNTTISNETLFRVGTAEATNRSAQFGFRSTNTNGSGVAVFSVFGFNALMMVGADASTNAVIFSGGGTNNEVMTLIRNGATEFARPIRFSTNASTRPATNAPANTTNVAAWVEFRIGTNSYRAPLYQ